MVTLSVTNDVEGVSGIVALPVNNILYMQFSSGKRRVVVHSEDGVFYTTGPLNYWTQVLNHSGFNFSVGDRTAAINIAKVVRVDDFFKTAYFDLDSKTGCMLSVSGFEDLKKQLKLMSINIALN